MKSTFVSALTALALIAGAGQAAQAANESAGIGKSFKGPVGLQLYSLRGDFTAKGVPATARQVAAYADQECGTLHDLQSQAGGFQKMLEQRGLKAVSSHFPFGRLKNDVKGVVADAKALGIKYAGCAWAAHKGDWDLEETKEAARVFNNVGEALAKEGITFFYHLHGFEFQPHGRDTLADELIRLCKKEYVSFQMDVLWIVFPGQDPAEFLRKLPGSLGTYACKGLKEGG